jgi:hypothetical protein
LYFFKREWVKQYIKEKNEELDEIVDGKVKENEEKKDS